MAAHSSIEDFLNQDHPIQENITGRGIVIPGGGRYSVCVWVLVNRLRSLGCALPIEVWRLGDEERDDLLEELLHPLNVKFVDAHAVRQLYPHGDLNGWALKPYAVVHSAFEEVILIDADNVPVRDPSFLFDSQEFNDVGALFWPDYWRMESGRSYWDVMEIPFRDEFEFESGQMVIDKRRCWIALSLTNWLCERGRSHYWKHCHGDKDCFRASWHRTSTPFAMPIRPVGTLSDLSMVQYDFSGERLFQHRHMVKWTLLFNQDIPDFWHEGECFSLIADLRREKLTRWFGLNSQDWQLTETLAGKRYCYTRCGSDFRYIGFSEDALITEGSAALERMYCCKDNDLLLVDECGGVTARLSYFQSLWVGRWLHHEKMPIVLEELC